MLNGLNTTGDSLNSTSLAEKNLISNETNQKQQMADNRSGHSLNFNK